MPELHVLHRNRFHPLTGATARPLAANAWEITVPATDAVKKLTRRGFTAEAWDGAVFLVDGVETEPAVGSGESKKAVTVTVFILEAPPTPP